MTRLLDKCLCCSGPLVPLIDFGMMPLANTYNVRRLYPLRVNRCRECFHLQLSESVDPMVLFAEYTYFSGTSQTALDFFRDFARMCMAYHPKARVVLDIACNDGTQLNYFEELGLHTEGVDPAANVVKAAQENGHLVQCALFESSRFESWIKFDIITAQNVLAHTPRPLEFLRRCRALMDDDSRLFITASQADMIHEGQFDTIYHEHVSYFNARSMQRLAVSAGLTLLDIRMNPIHGNSYVFVFGVTGKKTVRVRERIKLEETRGIYREATYQIWERRIHEKMNKVRNAIEKAREDGYYLVGCGAAAKGITFLNAAGIQLDVIVDTTPAKWGKVASRMTILPFDHIFTIAAEKICFVVLAWNFAEEVMANILKYRDNPKDTFITTK